MKIIRKSSRIGSIVPDRWYDVRRKFLCMFQGVLWLDMGKQQECIWINGEDVLI